MSRGRSIELRPPPGWTRYCEYNNGECEVFFVPPSSNEELSSIEAVEEFVKRSNAKMMINPLLFDFGCHSTSYDGNLKEGQNKVTDQEEKKTIGVRGKVVGKSNETRAASKSRQKKTAKKSAAASPVRKQGKRSASSRSTSVAKRSVAKEEVSRAAEKEPKKPSLNQRNIADTKKKLTNKLHDEGRTAKQAQVKEEKPVASPSVSRISRNRAKESPDSRKSGPKSPAAAKTSTITEKPPLPIKRARSLRAKQMETQNPSKTRVVRATAPRSRAGRSVSQKTSGRRPPGRLRTAQSEETAERKAPPSLPARRTTTMNRAGALAMGRSVGDGATTTTRAGAAAETRAPSKSAAKTELTSEDDSGMKPKHTGGVRSSKSTLRGDSSAPETKPQPSPSPSKRLTRGRPPKRNKLQKSASKSPVKNQPMVQLQGKAEVSRPKLILPPKKRGRFIMQAQPVEPSSPHAPPTTEEHVTLQDLLPVRETRQGFRSVAKVPTPVKSKKAKNPVRITTIAVAIEKPKTPTPPPSEPMPRTRAQRSKPKNLMSSAQKQRHAASVVPPDVAAIRKPLTKVGIMKERQKMRSSVRPVQESHDSMSSGDESAVLDNKLRKPASRALRVTPKSTKSKTVQKKTTMSRSDELVARQLLSQISAVLEGSRARRSSGTSGIQDLIKSQISERSFSMSGRAIKPVGGVAEYSQPRERDVPPRADTPEPPQPTPISKRSRVARRVADPSVSASKVAPTSPQRTTGRPSRTATSSPKRKPALKKPTPAAISPGRLTSRQAKIEENRATKTRKEAAAIYRGRKVAALKRKAKATLAKKGKAVPVKKVTVGVKRAIATPSIKRKAGRPRKSTANTPSGSGRKPTVKAKALPSPVRSTKPPVSYARAVRIARQISAKRRVKTIPPQVRGDQVPFTPTPGAKIVMPGVSLPQQLSNVIEADPSLPSPSSSSTETDSDAAALLMNEQGALNDFPFPYPASPLYRSGAGGLRKRTETENLETITLAWNPQDMDLYHSLSALSGGPQASGLSDGTSGSRRKSQRNTNRRVAAFVTQAPIANYIDPERVVQLPDIIANDHCYIRLPQKPMSSLESMEFEQNPGTAVSTDHSSMSTHDLLVSPYPTAQTVVVPSALGTLTTAADLLASVENPGSHTMSESEVQGDMPASTSPFLFHQGSTGINTAAYQSGVAGYVDSGSSQFVSNSGPTHSVVCGGYSTMSSSGDTGHQAGSSGSPPSNFLELLAGAQTAAFAASMDEMLASSQAGGRSRGASGDVVNLPLITGVPASVLSAVLATPNITPTVASSSSPASGLGSSVNANVGGKPSIHDIPTSSYAPNQYYDPAATRRRADLVHPSDFLPENLLEGDSTDMSVDNE